MIEFRLYNFEHNFTSPRSFSVGPFTINVTQPHIDNLAKLRIYGRVHLTVASDTGERVVNRKIGDQGETVETAVGTISKENCVDSILYPTCSNRKCVDDLCLILTFLTGRCVFLDDDIEEDHSKHYKTPPMPRWGITRQLDSAHPKKPGWRVNCRTVVPFAI